MSYIIYRDKKDGFTSFVDNRQKLVKKIRLGFIRLRAGERRVLKADSSHERVIVLLKGSFILAQNGKKVERLGPRTDMFTEKAWSVYIPVTEEVELITDCGFEAVICSVKADKKFDLTVIRPSDVVEKIVGDGVYERRVFDIVGADFPAQNLMLGETVNPAGNWSSFPPHKHDCDRGEEEVNLEEVYFFKVKPDNGFGFQRIYKPEKNIDEAVVVKDHCAVLIPEGYHPVCASPGYGVYYLWVLAGSDRRMKPYDDPEHAWIKKIVR